MGRLVRTITFETFPRDKPDLAEEGEDVGQGRRVDDDPPGGKDKREEGQAGCHWLSHKELGFNVLSAGGGGE